MKKKKIKILILIVITIIIMELGTMFYLNKINKDKDEEILNNINEIKNRSNEKDVTALYTIINYVKFNDLYNDSKEFILVLGESSCIHSLNYKDILNNAIKLSNEIIYYLELNNLNKEDINDLKSKFNSLATLNTPRTLIIKDKELIDEIYGYVSTSELLSHITSDTYIYDKLDFSLVSNNKKVGKIVLNTNEISIKIKNNKLLFDTLEVADLSQYEVDNSYIDFYSYNSKDYVLIYLSKDIIGHLLIINSKEEMKEFTIDNEKKYNIELNKITYYYNNTKITETILNN